MMSRSAIQVPQIKMTLRTGINSQFKTVYAHFVRFVVQCSACRIQSAVDFFRSKLTAVTKLHTGPCSFIRVQSHTHESLKFEAEAVASVFYHVGCSYFDAPFKHTLRGLSR